MEPPSSARDSVASPGLGLVAGRPMLGPGTLSRKRPPPHRRRAPTLKHHQGPQRRRKRGGASWCSKRSRRELSGFLVFRPRGNFHEGGGREGLRPRLELERRGAPTAQPLDLDVRSALGLRPEAGRRRGRGAPSAEPPQDPHWVPMSCGWLGFLASQCPAGGGGMFCFWGVAQPPSQKVKGLVLWCEAPAPTGDERPSDPPLAPVRSTSPAGIAGLRRPLEQKDSKKNGKNPKKTKSGKKPIQLPYAQATPPIPPLDFRIVRQFHREGIQLPFRECNI